MNHVVREVRYAARSLARSPGFSAAAFALVFVALAASYVPARRAAKVDPAIALRAE